MATLLPYRRCVSEALSIHGALSPGDIKRLTKLTRATTVGPTATYYAGVTAPVISAATAIFAKSGLQSAGIDPLIVFFVSTLLAAMSGIVWYLIFMRWSYRHTFGRGSELSELTRLEAGRSGLTVARGAITTHIAWSAVDDVHVRRGYTAVLATGTDAIVIPDRWFANAQDRQRFVEALHARGDI